MDNTTESKIEAIDGSKILVEACCQSGGDVFIGYPITPSNLIYRYSLDRFPMALAAPDEISTVQWMAGFSATGKFPVSATSFPGLALMTEGINMAFMMELPMLIIVTQRLGPSTGSATTGAQGDLLFLRGMISGGFVIPVICPADYEDLWYLTNKSMELAISLRCPVILLTSKEMVMCTRSFDLSRLSSLEKIRWKTYEREDPYLPYSTNDGLVPDFLPLGHERHIVRLNASTHDESGLIKGVNPDTMRNSRRLREKVLTGTKSQLYYHLDENEDSNTIIVAYGISSYSARDAVARLRSEGEKVSLLIPKTLLPVSDIILNILNSYQKVIIVEENLSGLYSELIYGSNSPDYVYGMRKMGAMISPEEIYRRYQSC
ncbi:MAG: hypothetical protein OEZ36_10295 [Spirochaetota bacterium]|nr:hypothetical protein [Spirochaetota bacterium]